MTIARILTASMLREPDALAIVDGETRFTYREWHQEIEKLTGGLAALGLEPGAHLVAVLSNRLEMASLYWACQMMGVIFTPFNWRASGPELAYVIE
ncbi:MAG: AMP-binding protein, partial [Pseudomonadota bacterium]|nr:AMP-binding protein [Pseudomonadota bacterium]